MKPERWHVYVVDLEPRVGTKLGKQRPCLCIQPTELAEAGLKSSVVLPLTTNLIVGDAYPLRVRLPKNICRLNKDSDIIVDQILAWDNSFFKDDLGILPEFYQIKVTQALRDFLDL
jgi:mRNA interferase MazF